MIKAVFFDAAGTLIYLPKSVGWHYRLIARQFGWNADKANLNTAFGVAWKAMPARVALHSARPDDDKGWWRELVGRVLADCGASAEFDRAAYFEELYVHFVEPGVWALFPEVAEVLTRLSAQFRLGIISNFDGRLRMILGQLDLARYFDFMAISSEVGADKPDAFLFQTAMEKLDVAPEEACHVGDDPAHDWLAAEAAGMWSFRLERPKNSLSEVPALLEKLKS